MALGTVGGTLRVHPAATLASHPRHRQRADARQHRGVGGSRVETSRPCARSPPTASSADTWPCTLGPSPWPAGAEGGLVERVATMIVEARNISLEAAQKALDVLRSTGEGATAVEE